MADQNTTKGFISPAELNQGEREELQRAASGGESAIKHVLGKIALAKNGNFSPEAEAQLVNQFIDSYRSQQADTKKTGASGFGDIARVLGAGSLALATADTSGSYKVIGVVDQAQLDTLFGDKSPLGQKDGFLDTGGPLYEEYLDQLSSDALFHSQYQNLENRVREAGQKAGLSEAEISEQTAKIRTRYEEQIKARDAEKNNPNKSSRQIKKEEKQKKYDEARKKRLRENLKAVDEATTGKGRKKRALADAEKRQRRRQLLEQYTREQLARNHRSLHDLLSERRFLRLGRRTSLGSPLKRAILGNIRAEKKKLKEEAKAKKKQPQETPQEQSFTEIERELPEITRTVPVLTPGSQQASDDQHDQGGGPSLPRLPKRLPVEPPLGGLAGGAGEAAGGLATFGSLLPWIIGGLLLLFFIIILVIILRSSNSNQQKFEAVQVTCGDDPLASKIDFNHQNAKTLADNITTRFKYGLPKNITAGVIITPLQETRQYEDALINVEKQIYTNLCVLYGHLQGYSYDPDTYNTFGTLVVGTQDQIEKSQVMSFSWILDVKDTNAPCSFEKVKSPDTLPTWLVHYNQSCTPSQFQFLMAQNLAHDLLMQQAHINHGTPASVFTDFTTKNLLGQLTPNGIIGQAGLLPTHDCQTGRDYGEHADPKTQQEIDCFADMVGEYFTYPNYLDTGSSFLLGKHGAFIAGTPGEIDLAAKAGMSYVINYHAFGGESLLDPSSPAGKELAKYHMKDFLDLARFINKNCSVDTNSVTSLVKHYDQSPLLGGYWIKDDDIGCDMKPAVKTIHDTIRQLDTNTDHIIMAGFGVASSMSNYEDGIADVLAFYPYPAYNEGQTVDWHVQKMVAAVKAATPKGATPPPFIGVYQAFWGDDKNTASCSVHRTTAPLSQTDVQESVQTFLKEGAIGVAAFSIGRPCDVNHTGETDTTLMNQIYSVRDMLGLKPL